MLDSDFLYPDRIKEDCIRKTEIIREECEIIEELYESVLAFINDDEIISNRFESLRIQLKGYLTVIKLLEQSMLVQMQDLAVLKDAVGYETLLGSVIKPNMRRALQRYKDYMELSRQYSNYAQSVVSPSLSSYYIQTSLSYKNLAMVWYGVYEQWKQKEILYDSIDYATRGLFYNVRELSVIDMGLDCMNSSYNGNDYDGEGIYNWINSALDYVKPQWIFEKMNINGSSEQEKYLKKRLSGLRLPWNQRKIDELWSSCENAYNEYGINVDPRFMLAIIIVEGTGSFDTSSDNPAADGGNGVETDYLKDLYKANSLILGKILGYSCYGKKFTEFVESETNKENGDIFSYCNWNTPIVRINSKRIEAGVYATDEDWQNDVRDIYEQLSHKGAAEEYSNVLERINPEITQSILEIEEIPVARFFEEDGVIVCEIE